MVKLTTGTEREASVLDSIIAVVEEAPPMISGTDWPPDESNAYKVRRENHSTTHEEETSSYRSVIVPLIAEDGPDICDCGRMAVESQLSLSPPTSENAPCSTQGCRPQSSRIR